MAFARVYSHPRIRSSTSQRVHHDLQSREICRNWYVALFQSPGVGWLPILKAEHLLTVSYILFHNLLTNEILFIENQSIKLSKIMPLLWLLHWSTNFLDLHSSCMKPLKISSASCDCLCNLLFLTRKWYI